MAETITINLRHVARGLSIPLRQVEAVVELLDDGNTVPFITRYRKDQTGGLDEEHIRQIQDRLAKLRLLVDRKQTVLRSIESQGKLSEKLAKQIRAASTTKRLEDLYLPFKPKKQPLATSARSRGLEPLAAEILRADPVCADLDARATDYVNPDQQVPMAADALLGAGHILAEEFSERADLRHKLREILQRTGRMISTGTIVDAKPAAKATKTEVAPAPKADAAAKPAGAEAVVAEPVSGEAEPSEQPPAAAAPIDGTPSGESPEAEVASPAPVDVPEPQTSTESPVATEGEQADPAEAAVEPAADPALPVAETPVVEAPAGEPAEPTAAPAPEAAASPAPAPAEPATPPAPKPPRPAAKAKRLTKAELRRQKKEEKRKRDDEKKQKAFQDYFDYTEQLKKIPPHRVLAINRGERAKVLRVKIEADVETMHSVVDEVCVPADHPHAEFLRGCARDALVRLILPSLEREVRREMTDQAETHAVEVFAKNLRNLLLQPPVRDRRVLAVDPGYKSGCKLVALDQFGNILDHGLVYLVGRAERREQARRRVIEMIDHFGLTVVAIGNGTASRETEDFFDGLVTGELKDRDVRYVIVNEAGASVYSTSRLGRDEFPEYDAALRGAISIGRRLQDPLSELVKIEPASIGVGLYQHDVKAKHLQTSLEEVVESCVNFVGADVNTASPPLLRRVSGLNQLTARRVYEHRMQHGPFRNRQQLRDVPGFGETTYVQAAGFLKIASGDNALDATWIHPESYELATKVLGKLGAAPEDLRRKETVGKLAEQTAQLDVAELSKELGAGELLLKDILVQLARPGRDPREDLPAPVLKKGVMKLENLTPGMELTGTVLNVVDFGAFVDIGMHDSGLVHVSQLADKFVRDSHEVVAVGDIVKVWVVGVDKERRRVSLTMIAPGPKPSGPPRGAKTQRSEGSSRPARPPRSSGDRKPRGKGGPPRGKGRSQGRPTTYTPKPRPKPLKPLSDSMKAGKEPMRTFGDLLQFYEMKKDEDEPGGAKKKKGDGPDDAKPADDKPQEPQS